LEILKKEKCLPILEFKLQESLIGERRPKFGQQLKNSQ